ncbi:hypothetical protein HN51_022285 [Arachis hypogaea]|uniref:Uncharacterized protein LOC107474613 n=1 Tax=Arachis duranensis TaxID=130453 RepID=A0A6P5N581_ARADU|nr:uncharacterized protein LOC107474613 [Arachis duranensis]XP_015949737.1 uncharacterized protein LOC107474613 [Arachis duranensis]XP_025650648.1 uncharacterized protein LOC112745316 [Arachis hypogaea]XP_025650649.1 uncharacterized protein LOC112745316 [Arachis hypogaea]XP_052112834.1 uncharacterized protein LOC107474613 [Arachis duranensis]XP_052112835.1 uncharacterized protein LOC107474613 [Arachis duranensis]XP_057741645.1 uncharacterized protein LOC130960292 [Arachis stenosperma]XP_0577
MAVTVKTMALIVSVFGLLSFILGVIAENKKPAAGTPVPAKGVVTCKFPADPTVALGYLSFAFLIVSTVAGYMSLFYPYKGKSVPQGVLFKSTSFLVFFNIAVFTTGLAATMLLWPTITEQMHLQRNVHNDLTYTCPTAKTGLLGGGAFLSLDSSLFWLIALMLADNAREDFMDEEIKGGELSSSAYATHTVVTASP